MMKKNLQKKLTVILTLALCFMSVSIFSAGYAFGDAAEALIDQSSASSKQNDLPKRVIVPKIKDNIKIDGVLDESAWQKAATLAPFSLNDGSGPAREDTKVLIGYNDESLYLAWVCKDADILATYSKRDDKLWEEEVAEFFVTPDKLTEYFELQWNPLGTIFDAIIHNNLKENGLSKGIKGDWDWTANGMQAVVKVDGTVQNSQDTDQQWLVEVKIPFKSLECSAPKSGDVWRANFYRYSRTTGKEDALYYSWSPTRLQSFHEPSRFGYLQFGQ